MSRRAPSRATFTYGPIAPSSRKVNANFALRQEERSPSGARPAWEVASWTRSAPAGSELPDAASAAGGAVAGESGASTVRAVDSAGRGGSGRLRRADKNQIVATPRRMIPATNDLVRLRIARFIIGR